MAGIRIRNKGTEGIRIRNKGTERIRIHNKGCEGIHIYNKEYRENSYMLIIKQHLK